MKFLFAIVAALSVACVLADPNDLIDVTVNSATLTQPGNIFLKLYGINSNQPVPVNIVWHESRIIINIKFYRFRSMFQTWTALLTWITQPQFRMQLTLPTGVTLTLSPTFSLLKNLMLFLKFGTLPTIAPMTSTFWVVLSWPSLSCRRCNHQATILSLQTMKVYPQDWLALLCKAISNL